MEITLKNIKTGRKNGKRIHAIYKKGVELWPKELYNASQNKILYVPFVTDGKTYYGNGDNFQTQNNNDIGYTFSSRTAVRGIKPDLQTNRFAMSFWMKVKNQGNGRANQGASLGYGFFLTLNLKHREGGFQNRFEYKSGNRWYAGPSDHGLNDGNWHFVTMSMFENGFNIWIDGKSHREKRDVTPAYNSNNKFNIANGWTRLIHDGNPQIEYAQVVCHKNGIILGTHQRWYNAMKEHFLSDYQ